MRLKNALYKGGGEPQLQMKRGNNILIFRK